MKLRKSKILLLLSLFILLSGCMKDDEWIDSLHNKPIDKLPENGLFVVNEGNFMYGNASLSFYDINKKTVKNNLFFEANGLPLGDVAQSMNTYNKLGYIVINNSGKIYIIDIQTGKYVDKITGLTSPRYIHFVNNKKAYITDLYAAAITIYNPENGQVSGKIETKNHESTEEMVQYGKYVFVSCWSYDKTILVIDAETDQIVDEITTGRQPSGMAIDKNDKLWVLCDGGEGKNSSNNRNAVLQRINLQTFAIEKEFKFSQEDKPTKLNIDNAKENLIFINKGIWKMAVDSNNLPTKSLVPSDKNLFYGLGIDPKTSEIYYSDAIDYLQKGIVYRCSFEGAKIDSFKTGIIPGSFCFK